MLQDRTHPPFLFLFFAYVISSGDSTSCTIFLNLSNFTIPPFLLYKFSLHQGIKPIILAINTFKPTEGNREITEMLWP